MDNDHDLLIRIDQQVKQLLVGIELERASVNARATKIEAEVDVLRSEVSSLRTTRAQFYTFAGTISFVISLLVKVFWK
jgi:hypothetical protein